MDYFGIFLLTFARWDFKFAVNWECNLDGLVGINAPINPSVFIYNAIIILFSLRIIQKRGMEVLATMSLRRLRKLSISANILLLALKFSDEKNSLTS